ncbi:tectonic-1-like isoform X2 [Toxotes jaculatrix]|uniref:tectonic-1-like isoform X2 n=1 Tax=Toxotes jaculatrix TaxID=941984 RepID=UPI001B3AEBDC|nr:tectonic-1-like isoform X2 [Toxotes jaculatrix]
MAVSSGVLWSFICLFCIFLSFDVVTADENITKQTFNVTASGDYNVTFNVTDNSTTRQPTELVATEPTPSYISTEEPVQPTAPAKPLPVSGLLLIPASNAGSVCPCDEHTGVCDINCCCDRECSEEVALFTGCSVRTVSANKQLCSWDAASYSLGSTIDGYSELQLSVTKETNYDIFCIKSQNRIDGLSHPSPALPTDNNFDSLFKQFTSFIFGLEENSGQVSTAENQTSTGYQYGDEMVTAGQSGERGVFWLPAPGVTADCVDTSPAAFLKDQSGGCSRRTVLDQDCSTLLAFNMDTYTNVQLFAGKNKDAAVVPVEVASVILQSVDGTQTELKMSGGENLSPVLLSPDLCANVVLKVVYVMKYSPAGEITNVTASLVLGFVRAATLPLRQEFQITFVQHGEDMAVQYSGNPGYVAGLPLVSGTRTAEGIVRSIDPRDTLSLLHSAEDQDCLRGPHRRSPVLFGLDSVSGCTLRLEDATNCSLVSQLLLDVLRGPNYPQYVASFGNSPLNNPLDWVQIKNNFIPGEAQSCSIPLSFHLEIEWTKYGSLVNPQPQIVSVKEVIQTNTSSLAVLSSGSGSLPVRISVAFLPVSAAALPGYRAMPTIDAKLPFDFFFPFV